MSQGRSLRSVASGSLRVARGGRNDKKAALDPVDQGRTEEKMWRAQKGSSPVGGCHVPEGDSEGLSSLSPVHVEVLLASVSTTGAPAAGS